MLFITLGALLIAAGVFTLNFSDLVTALKNHDHSQWETLGSPPPTAFSKTLSVFSWVMGQGYQQSASAEVVALGQKAHRKAVLAKYLLLAGVALAAAGVVVAIVNAGIIS